jgi:exodeoxyribonuclease III
LEMLKNPKNSNFDFYWHSCSLKKGYSGVANLVNQKTVEQKFHLQKVETKLNLPEFDDEGRLLISYLQIHKGSNTKIKQNLNLALINGYFPQGGRGQARIDYKLNFYEQILILADNLREKGYKIIITGDLNTTVKDIDLARPKENRKTTGCLPEERMALSWLIDKNQFENLHPDLSQNQILQASPEVYAQLTARNENKSLDLVDSFRYFYPDLKDKYTYWDQITRARSRNVGWRIDYFLVDKDLIPFMQKAEIYDQIFGSDHCPVSLEFEF